MKNIFQAIFYGEIDNHLFWVDGRFVEGDTISIGDIFKTFKDGNNVNDVNFQVLEILMYNRSMPTIVLGMTGRLILKGKYAFKPQNSFELISW